MQNQHRGRRRTWTGVAFGVAALALVAAGCGDGADDDASSGNGLEGDVFVTGSSTVEPISVRVAELLADVEPGVNVDVQGPGTGDGFAAFCAGEADVADASRTIEADEAAACEENGVEFIELKVAYDGISVLVNPDNPIECLSFADLYALVGPESQGVENWQDAQPLAAQLGSDTEFPDLPLEITAPGEESGTYDSFIELALGGIIEAQGSEEAARPDYSAQADDSVILQGVEGSEGGFGWVGFAYAEGAGDSVKEVPITPEPGGACVEPSAETISDGSYPLSRPLFIYVSSSAADANEGVSSYVDYYVNDGYSAVEEVGYVALPGDDLEATRTAWDDRTTGSQAG